METGLDVVMRDHHTAKNAIPKHTYSNNLVIIIN